MTTLILLFVLVTQPQEPMKSVPVKTSIDMIKESLYQTGVLSDEVCEDILYDLEVLTADAIK